MSAQRFLQIIQQSGLVSDAVVRQLREQVAARGKPVAASKVAKVLVDRGLLTKFQASQALEQLNASDTDPATTKSPLDLPELEEISSEPQGMTVLEPVDVQLTPEPAHEQVPEAIPLEDEGGGAMAIPVEADALPSVDELIPDETAMEFPEAPQRRSSLLGALSGVFGRRKVRRGQSWDSLLMIVGGGALILLALIGILLYLVLSVSSGDEMFAQAEQDYQGQLYRNAIERYEKFVNKNPKHAKVSLAKVRQATSRIRIDLESQDWVRAISTLEQQLSAVEDESAFPEARPELSGMLTDLYQGLVRDADESTDFDEKERLLGETARVQTLIDNPKFLPTSLRTSVQSRIEITSDDVAKITRDIAQHRALQSAVTEIAAAVEQQSSTEAYTLANDLLSEFPGLQRNPQLLASLQQIPQAEMASIRVESTGPTPQVDDHPELAAKLLLARRDLRQPADVEPTPMFFLVGGAIYGIEPTDGKLLWRRWIGFNSHIQPLALDGGQAVLAWDQARRELMRLDGKTGTLIWRLAVGADIAQPVLLAETVLVAQRGDTDGEQGRLLQLSLEDGRTLKSVSFPQGLGAAPGVDRRRGRLYLPGDHASLYVLDSDTLECVEVTYLGHPSGMIAVAPVVSGKNLFVVENSGEDYCQLHTFVRNAEGTELQAVGEPVRLSGQVFDPPKTFGRNTLLATDTGAVYSFEADLANAEEPLRLYTQVRSGQTSTAQHFARLVNQRIIVAGLGISEFELQAARGEIVRKWAYGNEKIHLAPPQVRGNVVIVAQKRSHALGARIEALELPGRSQQVPRSLWQLDVGAPPAVQPFVDTAKRRINIVSTGGAVWSISGEQLRAGVIDAATGVALNVAGFQHATNLPDGRVVLVDGRGTNLYWLYNPAGDSPRLDQMSMALPADAQVSIPVADENRLLVGTANGQMWLIDPSNGRPDQLPFQPTMAPGTSVDWNRPLVLPGGRKLLSTREGILYLVEEVPNPSPHLAELRTEDLGVNLRPQLATTNGIAFAAQQNRVTDEILRLDTSDLSVQDRNELEGTVVWGPQRVGEHVVVTTSTDEMLAFGPAGDWTIRLPHGPLAGRPLVEEGRWLCASIDGHLFSIDPTNGQHDAAQDFALGEPLALGPATMGGRWLLSGRDGTLFIVDRNQR